MPTPGRRRQQVTADQLLARHHAGRFDWLIVDGRRQKIRRCSILTHEGLVRVETTRFEHKFAPAQPVIAILE
jgi:hypothetical protein